MVEQPDMVALFSRSCVPTDLFRDICTCSNSPRAARVPSASGLIEAPPRFFCLCPRISPIARELEVAVETLWKRLPMTTSITDLARHLRCANCDEKGRTEVDARRALGYDGL